MRKSGISVYPKVFKKAAMLKLLADAMIEELKTSATINYQTNKYSEIKGVVKTAARNHMNSTAPWASTSRA